MNCIKARLAASDFCWEVAVSHWGVNLSHKEQVALVQGQDFQGEPLLSCIAPAETENSHWLQQERHQCCRPCVCSLFFLASRSRSFAFGVGVGIQSCLVSTYRCDCDCRRLEVNLNIICCEAEALLYFWCAVELFFAFFFPQHIISYIVIWKFAWRNAGDEKI